MAISFTVYSPLEYGAKYNEGIQGTSQPLKMSPTSSGDGWSSSMNPSSNFSCKILQMFKRCCLQSFTWTFGGFLKWWYPQHTPKWQFWVGKPMFVGYHRFRKPPFTRFPPPPYESPFRRNPGIPSLPLPATVGPKRPVASKEWTPWLPIKLVTKKWRQKKPPADPWVDTSSTISTWSFGMLWKTNLFSPFGMFKLFSTGGGIFWFC